jgi:hypothetical protein
MTPWTCSFAPRRTPDNAALRLSLWLTVLALLCLCAPASAQGPTAKASTPRDLLETNCASMRDYTHNPVRPPRQPVGDALHVQDWPKLLAGTRERHGQLLSSLSRGSGLPPYQAGPLTPLGVLDVTLPPFRADPTGTRDATAAIQAAVDVARDLQMVCYFPKGTYTVSDTIRCGQYFYDRGDGKAAVAAANFPCLLVGEAAPEDQRPRLVLAPGAQGFSNRADPRPVVHFFTIHPTRCHEASNFNFNQMLVGLNIEIGPDNPGAVGLRHSGAQGSAVEDCKIYAHQGRYGVDGICGAGGSFTNVKVVGGDVGIFVQRSEPVPTLTGVTLLHQRDHALVYRGAQTLSAVGLNILMDHPGPAVTTGTLDPLPAHQGQICLTDSVVEFSAQPGTAVQTAAGLYLRNVYVRNAKTLARGRLNALPGEPGRWQRVLEYALPQHARETYGFQYRMSIHVDGRSVLGPLARVNTDEAPQPGLLRRHVWDADFPSWQSPDAVNVQLRYNARGDGHHDDGPAIQKALDENRTVLLPRGVYRISSPLRLHPQNRLVGMGRHLTWIYARPNQDGFADPQNLQPLVRTAPGQDAANTLSMLTLLVPRSSRGAYALHWQSGPESVLRDVSFLRQPLRGFAKAPANRPDLDAPFVLATDAAAGRWYNFTQFSHRNQGRNYRHLAVRNARGPLRIYQLNLEYARADANAEFRNSENIFIYGLKGEGNERILDILNCRNVEILGYGGDASAKPGAALLRVQNSDDFLLANLVEQPRIKKTSGSMAGQGYSPDLWYLLKETHEGPVQPLSHRERPVLYRRGNPQDSPAMSKPAPKSTATPRDQTAPRTVVQDRSTP